MLIMRTVCVSALIICLIGGASFRAPAVADDLDHIKNLVQLSLQCNAHAGVIEGVAVLELRHDTAPFITSLGTKNQNIVGAGVSILKMPGVSGGG